MAVYVDNMRTPATVPNGSRSVSGVWSHLTADTDEELHEFALLLGLKRSYHQPHPPHSRSHYDVTEPKRKAAIRLGAIAVRIGCEPWRGLGQRRTLAGYFETLEAYAPDAERLLHKSYVFPAGSDRDRKIEAMEAGCEFDASGEPVPV
jgi:hypothetical protein